MRFLFYFLLILNGFFALEAAKILAVFPFPGKSQTICVQRYLKTLAERGHELTVVTAFPLKEKIKNWRDVYIPEVFENYENLVGEVSEPSTFLHIIDEVNLFLNFGTNITTRIWENKNFQQILKSNEKFDLLIFETLWLESLYALSHHYQAPLIGYSSFGTDYHIDGLVGNISPLSHIPLITTPYTDHMNFAERLSNFLQTNLANFIFNIKYIPLQQKILNKYMPQYKLDLTEVRKNFSLILLNTHYTIYFPRPYVPNMIEVPGTHITDEVKPLPADIAAFIEGAKHGAIYFALGSNVQSKDLPPEKLQILLRTFAKLPQRILWKFENPDLPGKPDNIFISKWFPQSDILGHPNVKLFITHGGLLSTTESISYGKPLVGIPFFYDQFMNVRRAEESGFGLRIDLKTLNEKDFLETLQRVLNEPKFTEMAKKLSDRFHDQPMKPLDKAIYWTEYVLRHKGASFMRSGAQDLNFYEFHNLDIIGLLLTVAFAIIFLIIFIVCKLLKFVRCMINNGKEMKKKKQH